MTCRYRHNDLQPNLTSVFVLGLGYCSLLRQEITRRTTVEVRQKEDGGRRDRREGVDGNQSSRKKSFEWLDCFDLLFV